MYCFLIASLPGLDLESQAPMTLEEFDDLCAGELDKVHFAALTAFDGTVTPEFREEQDELTAFYKTYGKFELYLRNRIARRRADKAGVQLDLPDPPEYYGEYDAAAGLLANTADPAERELIIDKLRWNFIEEQLLCKEFHFDALCAYRLKLAIVNKYRNRKLEPGRKTFDAALERLSREAFRQE
ncbi:MAG: DUF2764 family protein [Lentisphaeria bacterium]|nr:DUF2764 family protein [Lentisphaeria bacterium]